MPSAAASPDRSRQARTGPSRSGQMAAREASSAGPRSLSRLATAAISSRKVAGEMWRLVNSSACRARRIAGVSRAMSETETSSLVILTSVESRVVQGTLSSRAQRGTFGYAQ